MEKTIFRPASVQTLELLQKTMIAGNYSKRRIIVYSREIHYICAYYPDIPPQQ